MLNITDGGLACRGRWLRDRCAPACICAEHIMVYRPPASGARVIDLSRERVRRSREILAASYRSSRGKPGQQRRPAPVAGTGVTGTEAKKAALSLFPCPATNLMVQHRMDHRAIVFEDEYEAVTCPACAKLHFINRRTHKLLGSPQ